MSQNIILCIATAVSFVLMVYGLLGLAVASKPKKIQWAVALSAVAIASLTVFSSLIF